MPKPKLLVFCLDALCSLDIEIMRELPNLGWVIHSGSYVKHAEPIYPSLTYPCHTSILTGNYVNKHGIFHNEMLQAGVPHAAWFSQRKDNQSSTLLDHAKAAGYQTCALSWPVTGGADFDLNMPMIVPLSYEGDQPIIFLEGNATPELLEKYYPSYYQHLIGPERSLDRYTMAMALDIIRDYQQPDVMLVKMCDLDSVRHMKGVDNEHARAQLRVHDEEFGQILEAVRQYGDFENTHFVILGDHGQSDITQTLNLNILLRQNGFIRVDANGNITDFDAYCHSAELSAWIELKDPEDAAMRAKVHAFLQGIKDDPQYGLGHLFTKEEVNAQYGLAGPLDFVVEGARTTTFGDTWLGDDVFSPHAYKGLPSLAASHGALPYKDETTTFIACGPRVRQGVVIERASIVDDAPTMAAMLGFELPNVDGKVLTAMLKEDQ